MAAKEAAKFPDPDRGLDQFLTKLPSDVLAPPKLSVETQEINLGVLQLGDEGRQFDLRLENQGMRLLYGSVTCTDGLWLTLRRRPRRLGKALPVRPRSGVAGARGRRQVAGRQQAAGSPSVDRLQRRRAPRWWSGRKCRSRRSRPACSAGRKVRGRWPRRPRPTRRRRPPCSSAATWRRGTSPTAGPIPVQGPAASGLAAVQQFFEALGLTPAPKVAISVKSIALSGNPGEPLRYIIEVKTEEKKPIYAHGTSNQPWLEVGRPKINGRVAAVPLSVPSVPNKPGQQTHRQRHGAVQRQPALRRAGHARRGRRRRRPGLRRAGTGPGTGRRLRLRRAGGGNGRGHRRRADRPTASPVATGPARPAVPPQIQTAPAARAGRATVLASKPAWVHALPAALLALALLIVVIADLVLRPGATGGEAPRTTTAPESSPRTRTPGRTTSRTPTRSWASSSATTSGSASR